MTAFVISTLNVSVKRDVCVFIKAMLPRLISSCVNVSPKTRLTPFFVIVPFVGKITNVYVCWLAVSDVEEASMSVAVIV